jgi:hypothetical protein
MRRMSRLGVLAFIVAGAALRPAVAQVPAEGQGHAVAKNGPFTPPPCVPGVPFADITCTTGFDPWIEQFGLDGITSGCGGGNYCPGTPVTRNQMAVFIEKAMRGTANWPPHTQLVWAVKAADGTPDPVASGTALLTALNGIPISGNDAPSATNPWLVKIGPGIYDIGSQIVLMMPFVNIEGSGENATVITASGCTSCSNYGTLIGSSNTELRQLTVRNTGGAAYATAITGVHGSMKIESVTADASGGTSQTIGILITSDSPILKNVTAIAVPNPGSEAYGIWVSGGSPTIRDSSASASDSTSYANVYGIYANGSSAPSISNCTVLGLGNFLGTQMGDVASDNSAVVTVERSRLDPSSYGMVTKGSSTMRVVTSMLDGSNLGGGTTHVCAMDYNPDLTPFTCP